MSGRDERAGLFESVHVRIFNHDFGLRSPGGAERVRRAAALVDGRMREVSAQITTHDVAKVAILAALNLADELQSLRESYDRVAERDGAPPPRADEAAAGGAGRAEARQGDGPAEAAGEKHSWFEAIFDDEPPPRAGAGRLSAQVSAKLQSLRQQQPGGANNGETAVPAGEEKSG